MEKQVAKSKSKKFTRCVVCQNEIINRRRGMVKTCSLKCSSENKRRVQNENNRKYQVKKLKQCSLCWKWFKRRPGGSSYCLNCYEEGRKKDKRIYHRQKYWETQELLNPPWKLQKIRGWGWGNSFSHVKVNCLYCGQRFQKVNNSRYCSLNCRREFNYRKGRKLRKANVKYADCLICQKPFKKNNASVVCSSECRLEKRRKIGRKWAKNQRKMNKENNITKVKPNGTAGEYRSDSKQELLKTNNYTRNKMKNTSSKASENTQVLKSVRQDKRITGRTKSLVLKVTPKFHQELKSLAAKEGRFMTEILEEAWKAYKKSKR